MQTNNSSYFSGLRDSLTGAVLDYARSKYIDVEGANDDRNIRDRVDVGAGSSTTSAGMPTWLTVSLIVGGVVVGALVLRKVL